MRLLLDTHIWIWSLLAPERLGPRVERALRDPAHELWLSPISVWEAMLLAESGRVVVDEAPATWIERILRALPAREAPLTYEVAVRSRLLNVPHPDPADRFLAATAFVHDLTLVTADTRLLHLKGIRTLAN